MLACDRQVGERRHVVRLGIDHKPALLKAEIAARDPACLAHERVGTVGAHHPPRAHRPRLAGQSQSARLRLGDAPEREFDPVIGLLEPLGRPPALNGHPGRDARVTVDRPFELGLEEHVVALPAGRRRTARLEAQEQLTVGAEPAVVVNRNHLLRQHLGEPERLEQPHDLVIEVNRARETVDLAEALEHRHPVPGTAEHCRQRLPHRAVADDRDVDVDTRGQS